MSYKHIILPAPLHATQYVLISYLFYTQWASLGLRQKKNLPTVQSGQSLGQEGPLEKRMATHSSILAWRIPWIEKPGRLYGPRGSKESDTTEQLITLTIFFHFIHSSVYMSVTISQFILSPFQSLGIHMFVLYAWVSISVL